MSRIEIVLNNGVEEISLNQSGPRHGSTAEQAIEEEFAADRQNQEASVDEEEVGVKKEVDLADTVSRGRGFLIVFAGFIANFIVFGFGFTYGVFQDFYLGKSGPLYGKPTSAVSIIGSLATGLTYLLTVSNKVLSRYLSIRQSMLIGAIFMAGALISASFAQEIWQFALSQGVMFGIGSSMAYLPPVVHAPPYFNKHRGIAMGLLFSGTGIGGLALAPLTRYLITEVGWQWALRICGIISFTCLAPISFMVFPHPACTTQQEDRSKIVTLNLKLVRTRPFILHMTGSLLQSAGYLIPGYFMSSYGQTLGFSYNQGAVFIGVNNAVNAISKVAVGYFADKFGRLNMLVICCLLSAVTVVALWLAATRDTFISFVILYGVVSGPIISLLPTCMVELFGVQNYQSSTWFLYFCRGVGTFLGAPIAGLLIKHGASLARDYRNAVLYNAALFFANSLCFGCMRVFVASQNDWKVRQ
ncbi:uncharacterized protein ZBAI_01176 [Zygosaccharomyces bailii ISA1307]|nr:uncharacterized protein ZBAI_01176 [Zygosaccharomyces bailii ISA1307]